MATELVAKFEADLNTKMFAEYKEYTTSYNVTLSNIEDAIKFNNVYLAFHLVYAIAIKRIIES